MASAGRHTADIDNMKTRKTGLLTLMSCAGLAVVLLGCASAYQGAKTDAPTLESSESLVYLDAALKWQIPCESLTAENLPSGRTRVLARFQNKRNASAECQIQVKFKDANGRVIDETGWLPFVLSRREVTQFEHASLVVGAKDFTVILRAAKN